MLFSTADRNNVERIGAGTSSTLVNPRNLKKVLGLILKINKETISKMESIINLAETTLKSMDRKGVQEIEGQVITEKDRAEFQKLKNEFLEAKAEALRFEGLFKTKSASSLVSGQSVRKEH